MTTTLATPSVDGHLKSLDIGRPKMAQANVNRVDIDWQVRIGQALQRAISIAGLSHKETAAKVEIDEAELSRWLSGVRRPQFDKLLAVEELFWPVIQCLAQIGSRVEVVTTIRRIA